MITIKEINYNQITGTLDCEISGLLSSVGYSDRELRNGINSISNISRALGALLKTDDITLTNGNVSEIYYKDDYKYRLSEDEIKEFKIAPFAHQIDGINFCLGKRNVLLLDSMGVG